MSPKLSPTAPKPFLASSHLDSANDSIKQQRDLKYEICQIPSLDPIPVHCLAFWQAHFDDFLLHLSHQNFLFGNSKVIFLVTILMEMVSFFW